MTLFSLLFSLQIAATSYGDLYYVEDSERSLPNYVLDVSYSTDLSKSFLELHGLSLNFQKRIWKYISSGIFFHYTQSGLSPSGKEIKSLAEVDLQSDIPTPHWGVFALPQVQLFTGKWNLMNQYYLQVDFMLGAGAGAYFERPDISASSKAEASWLWVVDQRFRFSESFGLNLGFFGHRGGGYLRSGLHFSF